MKPVVRSAMCLVLLAVGFGVTPRADEQAAKKEKISGYAEWRRGNTLIVDGQRVVAVPATQFKDKKITGLDAIALGFEVGVEGVRQPDGSIVAAAIEAKPNGQGLFEAEIRSATNDIEAKWLNGGAVTRPDEENEGQEKVIGKIVPQGPRVDRLSTILRRVTPAYVGADALRVHVVETKEWNAMAMGNGALWVFTGLLDDMDDDEVALVVGHELAHYTHEHSRREFKSAMLWQLLAVGAIVATDAATDNEKTRNIVALASLFSVMTIRSGYSRNEEDQADRVGLRYAFEGGFDACKGPKLWQRFAEKYGDENKVLNFFLGDHPRSSARIKNMQQQIAYNYQGCLAPPVAGRATGGSADKSEQEVFTSMNTAAVDREPTAPATFTIARPHVVTSIMTYHWNGARGTVFPGTIALRDSEGRTYGPWAVTGTPGLGGVPNAIWTCEPRLTIPAGTYTIIDSGPPTWSKNVESGGRGMASVRGYPVQ